MVADIGIVVTQPASGHYILAGERICGIVEWIGRDAVDSRHVVDDERGVVEYRFTTTDRLLDRLETAVLGAGGLPRRVERKDRVRERRIQWIVQSDREGRCHRILEESGTAIGSHIQ